MTTHQAHLEEETAERLDTLADWESQCDLIRLDRQEALKSLADKRKQDVYAALPEELRAKIALIDSAYEAETTKTAAQYDSRLETVEGGIRGLRDRIEQDVLKIGRTVKAQFKMAVWNKGRITWDSRGLQGFQVAHPEISTFRKDGNPTVTLRSVSRR